MPLLSIITPCYNLGQFLKDNIDSVSKLPSELYEHIIIDDCSTKEETKNIIDELQKKGKQRVIRNEVNKELANSLNIAIAQSKGDYILVLSADDLLVPEAVVKAISFLEKNKNYDIVYGDCIKFGAEEGLQKSKPFNLQNLLIDNFIHAATVYRRKVWEENNGYDGNAPYMGMEDWEFWLHSVKNKFSFYYLDEPIALYRIIQNSKIRELSKTKARVNELMEYIFTKHNDIVGAQLLDDFIINRIKQNKFAYLIKWVLKAYFPNKFDKMCKSGKFRRYL